MQINIEIEKDFLKKGRINAKDFYIKIGLKGRLKHE